MLFPCPCHIRVSFECHLSSPVAIDLQKHALMTSGQARRPEPFRLLEVL